MTNKVWLDSVEQDPECKKHTLKSWLLSIRDNPDKMHIYHQSMEPVWGWQWTPECLTLAQEVSNQDNYKLIFGSHLAGKNSYNNTNPLHHTDKIVTWGEAWLIRSAACVYNVNQQFDYDNHPRVTGKWLGNYTCMMNKPKYHRYKLLEYISEYDPDLSQGLVTWARGVPGYDWHTDATMPQSIKHLSDKVNPDFMKSEDFNFFSKPPNFTHYWFDIISESIFDNYFYTEKTWRSIAYGKPFVILGAGSQNLILTQWGFNLFPELITYEYEHTQDHVKWYRDIIKPIFELTNKDMCELDNIWMSTYKYNYDLFEYIIMSDDYIPDIIREEIFQSDNDFYRPEVEINMCRESMKNHKPDFVNGIYA